jgi:hypothetical protein
MLLRVARVRVDEREEGTMSTAVIMGIVVVFVIGVLALVVYALYECTPFAHHDNPYRDSFTGRRRESPHVDEFRDFS